MSYNLLKWEYVCDQAPLIQQAHWKASDDAEYGVNFYEFIETAKGLEAMAQKWWDSLPKERQLELLNARLVEHRKATDNVLEAIKALEEGK